MTLAPDMCDAVPKIFSMLGVIPLDGSLPSKPRTQRGKGLGPQRSGAKGRHARRDNYRKPRDDDDWGGRKGRNLMPLIEGDDDSGSREPNVPYNRRGGKRGDRPYSVQSKKYKVLVTERVPGNERGRNYPSCEDATRFARGGQRGTPRYA